MLRRRSGDDVDNFRLDVRNHAPGFLVLGSTWVDVVSSYHFTDHSLSFHSCWYQSEDEKDEVHQDELGVQEEEDVGWGLSSASTQPN